MLRLGVPACMRRRIESVVNVPDQTPALLASRGRTRQQRSWSQSLVGQLVAAQFKKVRAFHQDPDQPSRPASVVWVRQSKITDLLW